MTCKALSSLLFSLALAATTFGQDVFVPRELKAQAVHPTTVKEPGAETKTAKPKEVVRRAEPVTDADLKTTEKPSEAAKPKTQKPEVAAVKIEKTATAKDKPAAPATAKNEKAPSVTTEPAPKKIAKAEPVKPEPLKEKIEKSPVTEKKATAKSEPSSEESIATIKVEKGPATKAIAKTEPAKSEPKKEKNVPAVKEKTDADVPMIRVEKATAAKEPAAVPKTVAKTDGSKPEPAKEKTDKQAPPKEKASVEIAVKNAPAKSEKEIAKAEKKEDGHKTAKTDGVQIETITARTEKPAVKEKPATVAVSRPKTEDKPTTADEPSKPAAPKSDPAKSSATVAKTDKPAAKEKPAAPAKLETSREEMKIAKADPPSPREGPANEVKTLPTKAEMVSVASQKEPPQILPSVSGSLDTGFTRIADGFDFPVGKPEAEGYYKARGFRPNGHVGEDWDGVRGGDTDMRDPIYSIGDGIVVFARDVHLGWGNVVIVRHAYRENGNVKYIDALYGHLNTMLVRRGQRVSRGQQIATMGNAHGRYDAHLHFEIRKNLEIGMSRSKFQKDFSNYYDPTQFIASHRRLSGGGANYKVAMNTFTHDWMYHFDSNRNFPARKRSTSESAAALRRALTSR